MLASSFNPYPTADVKRLRSEVVVVDPAMAKTLRSSCHFERQRPINARNVERLAVEMRRGWFIPGTPIFFAVLPDGSMRIVNGNHTLEAVSEADVSLPLVFIYARVDDIEGAARIYASMDLQKMRTWSNALQALGLSGEVPMSNYVLPAIGILMAGFKADQTNVEATSSRTARFGKVDEYKEAAALLHASWTSAPLTNQRLLRRAAFMAVALETARYQPSTAVEFWGGAAKDDGLAANDPRKALLRYATNNKAMGAGERNSHCKAAGLAWNAFFAQRKLEVCKPNAMGDFRLSGTPWHNGKPGKPLSERPLFVTGLRVDGSGQHPVAMFEG